MDEPPATFREPRFQVVVRIAHAVPCTAVAHLDEHDVARRSVHEVMSVTRTGLEPRAHPGPKQRFAAARHERSLAFEDVHELILLRMSVPQRGYRTGREARQVHAEVREPEVLSERTLLTPSHARCER